MLENTEDYFLKHVHQFLRNFIILNQKGTINFEIYKAKKAKNLA